MDGDVAVPPDFYTEEHTLHRVLRESLVKNEIAQRVGNEAHARTLSAIFLAVNSRVLYYMRMMPHYYLCSIINSLMRQSLLPSVVLFLIFFAPVEGYYQIINLGAGVFYNFFQAGIVGQQNAGFVLSRRHAGRALIREAKKSYFHSVFFNNNRLLRFF